MPSPPFPFQSTVSIVPTPKLYKPVPKVSKVRRPKSVGLVPSFPVSKTKSYGLFSPLKKPPPIITMSLDGVNGFLDVESAALRAPQVGIANTNPQHILSVGSNLYVSGDSSDVLTVDGNVVCEGVKVGLIEITPSYDLEAVANVGNSTSNTILFTNPDTGIVTTANVEIGGNITLTANAQVKVGSNVLTEYTGPHPRDPKEVPLKKYPEIAFDESKFDGNDTTNTYTQAGYTVTASSQANDDKNAATLYDGKFPDINTSKTAWQGINNTYDSNGDATSIDTLTGITGGVGSRNGSYTTLELPHKIKVSRLQLHTRNSTDHSSPGHPGQVYVYGSNDGSSWTQIGSHLFTSTPSGPIWQTIDINSTTPYNYFALQATSILSDGTVTSLRIIDLEWYGYEEPAPPGDLSLDTTLKSTFNSVRSNNYVMYFDGDGFDPNDTNSNNLVDNSSTSVVHHNATYDSTGKYWTLDGSTESNVTTGSLGLVGDAPHTVSTWINASNLEANASTQQLFSIGSGYSEEIVRVDDTQIAANTWHNVTYAYQGEGGSKVTYVDGRKVEEAQVEDTFGVYPPFGMSDYETGGYRVSASTSAPVTGREVWRAFDNDDASFSEHNWNSAHYEANTGNVDGDQATTTNVDGSDTYQGEWIQIEFPHKIVTSYYELRNRVNVGYRMPENAKLLGSNDGIHWTTVYIHSDTGGAYSASGETRSFGVGSDRGYKYFRLVTNKLFTNTESSIYDTPNIATWKLYGHKEGDLTRFPEPTRVLKYPHIAVGVPQDTPAKRGYVVTTGTSIFSGRTGARAFDDQPTGDGWETDNGAFSDQVNQTGGDTFTNLGSGGGSFTGHWIQLEMPHKLKFTGHIEINAYVNGTTDDRRPDAGAFLGSNDGSNWYLLHEFTSGSLNWVSLGGTTNQAKITTLSASNTNAYKYVVMVITKKSDVGTSTVTKTSIRRLRYYGTQEDTGTPAIVGGPFAGKVANFRVYDQYLGDERIQEIYDAQKDAFGHKKSSMTFYKGRIGVGTTEPEGALTVLDEPHALAKFPARAVFSNDSYVEGDGRIQLSTADGSGYQAFDGLTSTSWTATPTRNTRLSEEVDFGAWLKIQTPESMSLKKAEIESNPYWNQVGGDINGDATDDQLGRSNDCSHDGTRIILSSYTYNSSQGRVRVYDWNGSAWTKVGQTLTGSATVDRFGRRVAISGDGNIIAIAAPHEDVSSFTDAGTVRVYYLNGSTWTILPDSGALTGVSSPFVDAFVGTSTSELLGEGGVILSYDGKTLAIGERVNDTGGSNRGRARVFTYSGGAWSQKGVDLVGTVDEQQFGCGIDMSEDGNHLIVGTGTSTSPVVQVYKWNVTDTRWDTKGSAITYSGDDGFGRSLSISNDGNTIAVGIGQADLADGALADDSGLVRVYHYVSSDWDLNSTLRNQDSGADRFGDFVQLSGDGKRMVVSAPNDNSDRGKLYTFEYNGTSWTRREPGASIGAVGANASDYLGFGAITRDQGVTLSRDGSTIVGSELGHDTSGLSNNGRVRVWNMPSNIKSIWGSNDDVNWTKITTGNETFRVTDRLEFKNLDNPNYYKYHAIVADAFTRLKDIKLFGVRKQGSSTLHDGTLTLTKKVTAPQLESTGIVNMKGDYTEIRANSNVVTEFNRSKKLIKYPRVAMTQNDESGTSGYVASASTVLSSDWEPYEAFNTIAGEEDGWHDVGSTYSTGVYTGSNSVTPVTGGDVEGEWIQIQLPEKIKLEKVRLAPRSVYSGRMPKDATILGSINGTDWYIVTSWSGQTYMSGNNYTTINVDSEQYYNYYVLVVEALGADSSGNSVNIGELEFWGFPEYDPEAHGTDVVVKSVPNVPNTDWLEVYYDAKDLADGTTTVNDLKPVGTAVNGTVVGNTTVSDGAFVFDGSGDYIYNSRTGYTASSEYTASVWVKFLPDAGSSSDPCIFQFGNGSNHSSFGMISDSSENKLRAFIFGNNAVDLIERVDNVWYHLCATYYASNGRTDFFINGILKESVTSGTAMTIPSTPYLSIGVQTDSSNAPISTTYFTGSIANFRLFNRALTSDEVWQLYAYQKEYFGHGDLGMTLKAGRLGIGTSEPQAALDVRGDILGGCPAFFNAYRDAGNTSGAVNPLIWNKVTVNKGEGYDNVTGKFTASVSGYYRFDVYLSIENPGGEISLQWQKNDVDLTQKMYGWANIANHINVAGNITIYLLSGDTFHVKQIGGAMAADTSNDGQSYTNGFSGFYLSS